MASNKDNVGDGGGAATRFKAQHRTTQERLSHTTVGLVNLSDFRKRRAEVLDGQERESETANAAKGTDAATSTPNRSLTGTPAPDGKSEGESGGGGGGGGGASEGLQPLRKKKKKAKSKGSKLSFAIGDEDDGEEDEVDPGNRTDKAQKKKTRLQANSDLAMVPKALTKAALRREAAEREASRQEFLQIQDAVKSSEIAVPFVFYDGTNLPGGVVRVKKGDFIWVFLDKSRKVGAERSERTYSRREWAMISVDDLILVRGTMIIPHHYDFYFFIINKNVGADAKLLFDYASDAPKTLDGGAKQRGGLMTAAETKAAKAAANKSLPDVSTLEGFSDDATFTKVVDRRWYERNKHIYPASSWQEFDPETDYVNQIRKDAGGNTFFYSR